MKKQGVITKNDIVFVGRMKVFRVLTKMLGKLFILINKITFGAFEKKLIHILGLTHLFFLTHSVRK